MKRLFKKKAFRIKSRKDNPFSSTIGEERCLVSKKYFYKRVFRPIFMNRMPLEHLTGKVLFCGRDFTVSSKVLICRQDSEVLIDCLKDNVLQTPFHLKTEGVTGENFEDLTIY